MSVGSVGPTRPHRRRVAAVLLLLALLVVSFWPRSFEFGALQVFAGRPVVLLGVDSGSSPLLLSFLPADSFGRSRLFSNGSLDEGGAWSIAVSRRLTEVLSSPSSTSSSPTSSFPSLTRVFDTRSDATSLSFSEFSELHGSSGSLALQLMVLVDRFPVLSPLFTESSSSTPLAIPTSTPSSYRSVVAATGSSSPWFEAVPVGGLNFKLDAAFDARVPLVFVPLQPLPASYVSSSGQAPGFPSSLPVRSGSIDAQSLLLSPASSTSFSGLVPEFFASSTRTGDGFVQTVVQVASPAAVLAWFCSTPPDVAVSSARVAATRAACLLAPQVSDVVGFHPSASQPFPVFPVLPE